MSDSSRAATTGGGAGRRRSVARLLAVQALYQIEINKVETSGAAAVDAVIAEFVKHRLAKEIEGENYGEADRALFADIVRGACRAPGRARRHDLGGALSEEWRCTGSRPSCGPSCGRAPTSCSAAPMCRRVSSSASISTSRLPFSPARSLAW